MKVLVMCPGTFTAGLNSPERGEGRWSQNYAVLLAKAGHDVYAASAGMGNRTTTEQGVKLIDQSHHIASKHGPFDLYIDSAWWDGKKPAAKATKYVALKWSPENYLHGELPDDFFIAYPYTTHHYNFHREGFPNGDKTFALPTLFGEPLSPNWSAEKVFLPGKIADRKGREAYFDAIVSFLSNHPVEGTSLSQFQDLFGDRINYTMSGSRWVNSMPYNEVLESMRRCRISLPILNPGAIIEASFMGVPSVFWEHGGFFNSLGQALGIGIEHDAPPERFTEVAELLMNDKKRYHEIVYTMQDYFVSHTFSGAIKYFNLMCDSIGLSTQVSK
jgi:hypothetical protein